jgi:uncharacterized protein (TIGR00730 family)
MKNILVYCGSSKGYNDIYQQSAEHLGKLMVARQFRLVYGAGSVGLMGVIADAVLAQGGEVIGVIPQFLSDWEVGHRNLTENHVVSTMHERKQLMAQRSDAVVAMPGGYGTLDELFEILTWKQLQLHQMPIGLLNVRGYFNPLLAMIDRMVEEGFLKIENKALFMVADTPEALLDQLEKALDTPTKATSKWLDKA